MLTTFWSHRWLKNASSRFYSERTFLSLLRKLIKFVMSDLDKKFPFNRHFLMFFRNNDSSKIWHKKEPASATLPKGRMFITWLFPVFTSMLWSKLNHINLFDTLFLVWFQDQICQGFPWTSYQYWIQCVYHFSPRLIISSKGSS